MSTWNDRDVLIALDVFGTLADTASVERELRGVCGDAAGMVASTWRARQLEYMFRSTAMGSFPPFPELTRWALRAALADARIALPASAELERLGDAYRRLVPFADVVPALRGLRDYGHRLVVFSVGPRTWLNELTRGYSELIDDIVSAEDAGVYKPHPQIYRHLLEATNLPEGDVLLVSSNPFDIIGGGAVGLRTAWCRRDERARFDPWGPPPDHTVAGLTGLCSLELLANEGGRSRAAPQVATRPSVVGEAGADHRPGPPMPAATYGDLTADVYDDLYAGAFDTDGAVDTLEDLTGDGDLLDLGCGTGRLLVPLAERGVRVEGIEASPAMIDRLRARRGGHDIPVHQGDFADVAAAGRYNVIVVAVSTLFMLADQQAQLRCMANSAKRLAEGGSFIVEAFVPDSRRYDSSGRRTEIRHFSDERLHIVHSEHDPLGQRVRIEHILVEGGRLRRYPATLRYAPPAELDLMAHAAGLAPLARWGGWRRQPFTATTTDHVTVYARRDG